MSYNERRETGTLPGFHQTQKVLCFICDHYRSIICSSGGFNVVREIQSMHSGLTLIMFYTITYGFFLLIDRKS